MSTPSHCLNCENKLKGPYCEKCGQKAIMHRPSLGYFISHDLPHAILHLDKGFLFTLKEVVIRPGYAAKEYITGKRVRHYNIFALIIILIGFSLFISHYIPDNPEDAVVFPKREQAILDFMTRYAKPLIFLLIPLFALSSYIVYRRLQYNYTEHLIAAAFALAGVLLINLVWDVLDWKVFPSQANNPVPIFACFILYIGWLYFQMTRPIYTSMGYAWRMICHSLLTAFLILMILFAVVLASRALYL